MRFALLAILALVTASTAAHASSVILGSVNASPECASAPMEAWLSIGTTLLYQVEVPQHGTFEFHVNSGSYNLVAIGSTACFAETKVELGDHDTRTVELKPMPSKRPEARSALDWIMPSAYADCPFCGQSTFMSPMPSFYPQQQYPWWAMYGSMSYPNFYMPGPWTGGGISGGMFPGQGGAFMAKPVLYVNGPDGTPVKIRAELSQAAHWLVAVPAHGEAAWSGTIQGNHFKTADAEYRYLYYDYRYDERRLQDTRGFCTKRDDLMPKLAAALKASGFKKNEIEDFDQYWSLKIPPSDRYCVYPQQNAELQQAAKLSIEPKPASLTQLLFIVQLGENLRGSKEKFRRAPTLSWKASQPEHREPASRPSGIEVREWGIGFLQGQP